MYTLMHIVQRVRTNRILQYLCNFFLYVKSIEQEWNMSQETEYSSKILRFEDIIHICIIYIANLLFSLKINT